MKNLYLRKNELDERAFKNPYLFLKYYIGAESPETYSDKELTLNQCQYGANRSFVDLYRLVKTYFPGTTIEHFAYIFTHFKKNFCSTRSLDIMQNGHTVLFCPDIEAVVVAYGNLYYEWLDLDDYYYDEELDEWLYKEDLFDDIPNEAYHAFLKDKISYANTKSKDFKYRKYNLGGKYSFNNIYRIANKYRDTKLGRLNGINLIKQYESEDI